MHLQEFQTVWRPLLTEQMDQAVHTDVQNDQLRDALLYALNTGGKRMRPLLTLAVIATFKQDPKPFLKVANAVELIHTYSLIHDDLPAMDDDDFRRGQPTTHRKFNEAVAILAGDALQPLAYAWLADPSLPLTDAQRLRLIAGLAELSGANGMVGGQILDMAATGQDNIMLEQALLIHAQKTGALLNYAIVSGGLIAEAPAAALAALDTYANAFGLAFQIKDDLDDLAQDDEEAKQALPTILGAPAAVKLLAEQVDLARQALDDLAQVAQIDPTLLLEFLDYFQPTLEKTW